MFPILASYSSRKYFFRRNHHRRFSDTFPQFRGISAALSNNSKLQTNQLFCLIYRHMKPSEYGFPKKKSSSSHREEFYFSTVNIWKDEMIICVACLEWKSERENKRDLNLLLFDIWSPFLALNSIALFIKANFVSYLLALPRLWLWLSASHARRYFRFEMEAQIEVPFVKNCAEKSFSLVRGCCHGLCVCRERNDNHNKFIQFCILFFSLASPRLYSSSSSRKK